MLILSSLLKAYLFRKSFLEFLSFHPLMQYVKTIAPKIFLLIFLTAFLGTQAACTFGRRTVNTPIHRKKLQEIQIGKSTAKDVTRLLGAPAAIVRLDEYRHAYLYEYVKTKATVYFFILLVFGNVDERAERVWVFFDEKQIVSHIGKSFDAEKTEYAFPWEDIHE